MISNWITPEWPAPRNVKAVITTRHGGVSQGVYAGFNLGDHVGDLPEHVKENRENLRRHIGIEPRWLKQVHGNSAVDAEKIGDGAQADAAYARSAGVACVVLTADCLPILLCNRAGTHVAAIHAGWRGLSMGVIESTIGTMDSAAKLLAYLGPAIGPQRYEVGDDVREVFVEHDSRAVAAFVANENGKWLANLYELARQRLYSLGVDRVYGGDFCTAEDAARFYSYRRDGVTGRTASLIWLNAD
jgi:polyphenol oxidase